MDNGDFIISVHALDRFEERFPDDWSNDADVGHTIYDETMDALEAGRVSSVAPLEFADNDVARWGARKSKIVWNQEKTRGYVIVDGYDGMTVATVLVGQPMGKARDKLYGATRPKRR